MILLGSDDQSVSLTPVGYEFGGTGSNVTAVSDDWIVIDGEIKATQGNWTFRDSSLLAVECLGLGKWLTEVADFKVPTTEPDEDPTLTFLEPSLAFSVAAYVEESVSLRVHLTHLAAPPWLDLDEKLNTWTYFVELPVGIGGMQSAVSDWNREAKAFPPRTQRM
jgi:hypothetical protein